MHYTFKTTGTCSKLIDFDLDDGIVSNIVFTSGCNGNLKGISSLCEGMRAEDIIARTEGILCGFKKTSCPDQLARALKEAMNA